MPFKSISNDQFAAFISALKTGQYNLLLGAGSSMDARNSQGILPSGSGFLRELCKFKSVNESYGLQRVFSILSQDEIEKHVTKRFEGCSPGPTAKLIRSFIWKRIFTWNIDDVIENAYSSRDAKQKIMPLHFMDEYIEANDLTKLLLIHLHGFALRPADGYIFSRNEYVNQMRNIGHWMTVLTQFMQSEPMIVSGTSMDEVDLDFYLSHRSSLTSRDDRAPSILVEGTDDAITASLCEKHNLLHFIGFSHDFFDYCMKEVPLRPTPYELLPQESLNILPANISKRAALAFHADFELVPGSASKIDHASKFLYGDAPSWSDLSSGMDIPRKAVPNIISRLESTLSNSTLDRIVFISDNAGMGKTTVLRRVSFELASRGVRVLLCSALSNIDNATPDIIDQIDGPLVVVADNFADQASSIGELIERVEKKDIAILAAERGYRRRYLEKIFPKGIGHGKGQLSLSKVEAERLLDNYTRFGLIGDFSALKNRAEYLREAIKDPIAVLCCRLMNDFKPLERIINDLLSVATDVESDRYLLAAVAQHCFKGGVRYEILVACTGAIGLKRQFERTHPLPLAFFGTNRDFVVPENSTIGDRLVAKVAQTDKARMLSIFGKLANNIAARVNRKAIISRTPEARLAGRLFDFDDVTSKFLGPAAETFYTQTRPKWQWNSRYWEQVSLLKLGTYFKHPNDIIGYEALDLAVQHARHAVSVELHPFPLSTLGKVLMTKLSVAAPSDRKRLYEEAFRRLSKAIELESSWSRNAIQPFASLFRGTMAYLNGGGRLDAHQSSALSDFVRSAENRFGRDPEAALLLQEMTDCMARI